MKKVTLRKASKNNRIATKKAAKNTKVIENFHPVTYLFKNIPRWVYIIFIGLVLFYLYHLFIQPEFDKQVAERYLRKKYNKEFSIRKDHSAPNWIGKPPTYHGLAKVKDGSDNVEFVVVCGLDDLVCVDRYLESYWGASEERHIREYLGNDLPGPVEIKVEITSRIRDIDKKAQLGEFEYYLSKFDGNLVKSYQVMFLDRSRVTDTLQGSEIIRNTSEYIKNKVKTGGIHYAIYNEQEKECVSNYDTHNKDGTLNDKIIFEKAFGFKGEEKCQ